MEKVGFVMNNEGEWEHMYEDSVHHDKPLTHVKCFTQETLLTCCEDNIIKVWKFNEDGANELWRLQASEKVKEMAWNEALKTLALVSESGKLAIIQGDFEKAKEFKQE